MKMKRWIALLLIAVMTLGMVTGCKKQEEDDFTAETDELIGIEDESGKTEKPEKEDKEPSEETKDPEDESKEPSEEPKEPEKENQEPSDEKNESGDQKDETDQPSGGDADEEDLSALKNDTSGTAISFLIQNLKTTGNQTGSSPTEREPNANTAYNRCRRFKSMVKKQKPDIILCSEGTKAWVSYFQTDSYFKDNYTLFYHWANEDASVWTGTPILYKTAKFKELAKGYFWLSETPDASSPFYGDAEARISLWVQLQDKESGEKFYAYATHFGFAAEGPIRAQAQYIELFNKMKPNEFAFVGGDYNVDYRDADYQGMMEWDSIIDLRDMAMYLNDRKLVKLGGMHASHNGSFDSDPNGLPTVLTSRVQIDHLMAKPNPHMTIDYYGLDYNVYDNAEEGVAAGHISDHFGLVVHVRIGTKQDYSAYQCEYDYGNNPKMFNADNRDYPDGI